MVFAAGFHAEFSSSAMPHFGHAPGLSDSTPGHIGQKYFAAAEGVTATQHGVLLALSRDDGQPISAIADSLKMGKSSLTGLVDRMAADGLVRREIDADDLRVQRIFIERRGRGIVTRTLGDVTLTSKLIDGTFPDYERVIPKGNANIMRAETKDFAQAVDRVATVSAERSRSVRLAPLKACSLLWLSKKAKCHLQLI